MSNEGRVDDLSLRECHAYDPKPSHSGGKLRFYCPRHGGDKQQSLEVAEETGKFRCYNGECMIWGTVVERKPGHSDAQDTGWGQAASKGGWGRSNAPLPPLTMAEAMEPNEYALQLGLRAKKRFLGSPAEEYARRRGIPDDFAKWLSLGFLVNEIGGEDSEWLTFPLRCPVTGEPVSIYARNLKTDEQARKARVFAPKGLFGASCKGPMPEEVILVEGVFEVITILNSPGLPPARAAIGTSARPEWFDSCRRVILMLDDDKAGQGSTDRLVEQFKERRDRSGEGPQVLRMLPESLRQRHGVKDLGDLLKQGIPVKLNLPPLPEL